MPGRLTLVLGAGLAVSDERPTFNPRAVTDPELLAPPALAAVPASDVIDVAATKPPRRLTLWIVDDADTEIRVLVRVVTTRSSTAPVEAMPVALDEATLLLRSEFDVAQFVVTYAQGPLTRSAAFDLTMRAYNPYAVPAVTPEENAGGRGVALGRPGAAAATALGIAANPMAAASRRASRFI